ncbi:MAG TPA: polysaccharide biosynthesis/export family protein [Verrucomicrobiae bacterium]
MSKLGNCALLAAAGLLLTGCYMAKRGERFDARANSRNVTVLTNLSTVESTNTIQQDWLRPPTNFFTLGPGDKLEVEILGDPSSRALTTVGPDGRLYYYLLPGVDVWGLTLDQAKERIELGLREFLTEPRVALQLRSIDSTRVWILGRVANAGIYPMAAPMTLLEAISLAGGTMTSTESGTSEDLADLPNSFVVRNGERLPVSIDKLLREGDMRHNIYLHPDDFVFLPSSVTRDIYVLGAVRNPKAVPRQHNTLIGAIAEAGGPAKNSHLTQVAIVRGSLDNPKIAIIDYTDIVSGKASNVLLEPRDIVYVPYSPYRFINKYLDLILLTFVRAVAINEGARAAEPTAAPAGVTIGVSGSPGTVIGVPTGSPTTTGTP